MRYVFYAIAAILLLWSLYLLFRWIKGNTGGCNCCGGGCGACVRQNNCMKSADMKKQ